MGFLDKLKNKYLSVTKSFTSLNFMNGFRPTFTSIGDDLYKSQVFRAGIDAIARNASKFTPKHVRVIDGDIKVSPDPVFQRMLAEQPNPIMNANMFYYKMVTILENKNNAFALIDRDMISGKATMMLPVSYSTVEALEHKDEFYMKFILNNGQTLVVPYEDLIHLRKFYYDKDVFGEDNCALAPTIELVNTVNDGVSNSIQSSATLRGVLATKSVMNPDDMRKQRDDFVRDYLGSDNNGGIAMTDAKMEFTPTDSKATLVNADQMNAIKNEVYDYLGINENIVQSNWSEAQLEAFFEGKLEPLADQMTQEFTNKLFTKTQKGFGNKIVFETNKIAMATIKTKIQMTKEVASLGAITINEVREWFNMAPVEGGDKRVQTLNVVNADLADDYQTGGGESNEQT